MMMMMMMHDDDDADDDADETESSLAPTHHHHHRRRRRRLLSEQPTWSPAEASANALVDALRSAGSAGNTMNAPVGLTGGLPMLATSSGTLLDPRFL